MTMEGRHCEERSDEAISTAVPKDARRVGRGGGFSKRRGRDIVHPGARIGREEA
jgi:hypothetical protein